MQLEDDINSKYIYNILKIGKKMTDFQLNENGADQLNEDKRLIDEEVMKLSHKMNDIQSANWQFNCTVSIILWKYVSFIYFLSKVQASRT